MIHYDVEVLAADAEYNRQGWHDPAGHYYRLLRVQVRDVDGTGAVVAEHPEVIVDHRPDEAPVPLFPRANHGDLVELTLYNSLGSFPADRFDLGQLPAECALHVHLVKFDPLAADGSSTGWNYLSGASSPEAVGPNTPGQPPRNTSLHRWVVDEEFGPCFFHDHLLANYRQKHGLFAALIAEPPRSQWHTADQEDTAWDGAEAVVVPPTNTGIPPFRDFCLAVGDFVPLLDRGGRPLNPPRELGGFDDPGSMAVNYRSAPLTFRGPDPSTWFTTHHDSPPEDQRVGPEPEVEVESEEERRGAEVPRAALPGHPDDPQLPRGAAADPVDPGLPRGAAQLRDARDALAPRVAQPTIGVDQPADVGDLGGLHPRRRPGRAVPLRAGRPPVAVQQHRRHLAGLLGAVASGAAGRGGDVPAAARNGRAAGAGAAARRR